MKIQLLVISESRNRAIPMHPTKLGGMNEEGRGVDTSVPEERQDIGFIKAAIQQRNDDD